MLSIAWIFLSTKRVFWKITRTSNNNNELQVRDQAIVWVFNKIFASGGEIDYTQVASLPGGKVTAYSLSTLLFAHQLHRVINFLEGYAQFKG